MEVEREANRIRILDEQRRKALASRDAVAYFKACENIGFEPEDRELYEQGAYISDNGQRNHITPDRNVRYKSLISRAQGLKVEDRFAEPNIKMRILQQIWPEKFGMGERQDIGSYTSPEVGTLFYNMVRDAKRAIEREKKKV